ncbi:hypothetical protein [Rickettsia argasii]|nr:hypothetical protein [Rickettsia argasii]
MNKLSIHPPAKKSIEEFILEAEYKKSKSTNNKPVVLPWENDLIRNDVQKVFTVKLSEVYLLKIKYISEQTNKSQQRIIREIICREIDKLL